MEVDMSNELASAVLQVYSDQPQRDYFGISSISPCPRETYLNYVNFLRRQKGELVEPVDLQFQLILDDGHYQESEVVDLLKRAGFNLSRTGKQQMEVHVGRAKVLGHPDGINKGPIESPYKSPRMLEIKARNYSSYKLFVEEGLKAFPRIRCQTQLYLASEELTALGVEESEIFFKHKESCRNADVVEKKDSDFSTPIIEAVDRILVDGEVPDPVEIPLCESCRFQTLCWGSIQVDFEGITYKDLSEESSNWVEGDSLEKQGSLLKARSMIMFVENIGDHQELVTDTLRIQRQGGGMKRKFNRKRFIEERGEKEFNTFCDFEESAPYLRVYYL